MDTTAVVSTDEILQRAAQVYQGLTTDQIAEVETIALDRRQFFREPAADVSGPCPPRYGYPLRTAETAPTGNTPCTGRYLAEHNRLALCLPIYSGFPS